MTQWSIDPCVIGSFGHWVVETSTLHIAQQPSHLTSRDIIARAVTLSYSHVPSETPLLGETIGACLDRMASTFGESDALISCHQGIRYTYRQLRHEAETVARGLMSLGVERGDRVGVWSPNCAEWLIAQYASAKTGAIMV